MHIDWADDLIAKHRRYGVLLDSNLLLLMVVGNYDFRRISKFKRTSQFNSDDYELLMRISEKFAQMCTTPNIMTEVDNLGRQLNQSEWEGFAASMNDVASRLVEISEPSMQVTKEPRFPRLGLTDTAILMNLKAQLLLTDDLKLEGMARSAGLASINFNNLRRFG